jgi:hypothetical protein
MFHNQCASIFHLHDLHANLYVLNSVPNPFHISDVGYLFLPIRGLLFQIAYLLNVLRVVHLCILNMWFPITTYADQLFFAELYWRYCCYITIVVYAFIALSTMNTIVGNNDSS